jgi:glycine betaine/proline transport system permease protein
MADVASELKTPASGPTPWSRGKKALGLVAIAVVMTAIQYAGLLPDALFRIPEGLIPPFAIWLDVIFNFVKDDLGLLTFTRTLTEGLEWLLDTTANLMFGKRRWPHLGPIPWTAVAGVAAVVGYYLGGWRMALLGCGTFIWTALIGQWKIAMETVSVLMVAAPLAFFIGLTLGILAWKYLWVNRAIKPILSVLQTLPSSGGDLFQGRSDGRCGCDHDLCDSADDPDDNVGPAKGLSRGCRGRKYERVFEMAIAAPRLPAVSAD